MTSSPPSTRSVRGWRRALLLTVGLAAVGLTAVACSDDPDANATLGVDGTQIGIDRDSLLGELSEVRVLFTQRSELPSEVIADVDYDEGTLNITLAASSAEGTAEGTPAGVAKAEQVCDDLSKAIQLPKFTINVDGPDGARLASCEFGR